jgi:hypothetical protein
MTAVAVKPEVVEAQPLAYPAPARPPYVGPKPAGRSRLVSVADFESRGVVRKGYVTVTPAPMPAVRDTAFGRIVENSEVA